MDELGFDFNDAAAWFHHQQNEPFALVKLTEEQVNQLIDRAGVAVRRCYISDQKIIDASNMSGLPKEQVLASRLPSPGSTMAGDFGEILGYFYQSTKELPGFAIGVKKWRLKQDRTKPAPKSDVVHFVMPHRPQASGEDSLLCAEVKVKSTSGSSTPITSAIEDSGKDQTSRLASTLVWLRERAITEPEQLGDVDIPLLNRFINLVDHPPIDRRFHAIAVICEGLVDQELIVAPDEVDPNFSLLVIVVPHLKETYESLFSSLSNTLEYLI
ncbi:TPA: DUF1837 domain-containing protein [Vibrio parahaemolyticus]|uniref:Hachiman antiphage defense system protein HamA n=1 Tax=Vibrio TaxID=662 RepID=UPI002285F388|nr:Hachiman antiphage defense system protein HamA [Vibrio diabolicus]MCZ0741817.1 SAVED domain-containing protein [Vibrio diabolicus]MEE3878631.1 Hachiman antiphage defense system protein HamA [Vibrio sp. YYF0003]HCG6867304.1 DUF1837 domain-containing protein [Vibrio parahaemolyticus]